MVQAQQPTVMPNLTPDQFAQRLVTLYPNPWTGDAAKQPGGNEYAILKAFGTTYLTIEQQLQYSLAAARIATAEDQALDRVALDYFGPSNFLPALLTRNPGESDTTFRKRVFAALLPDAVTRQAIINAITKFVGSVPRVVEPFDPTQTGSYDNRISYYDYDTPANPARYGDTLPAQIFIESALPNFNGANLPIYGYDAGLTYDYLSSSGGYYLDPQPSWFAGFNALDELVNLTRAQGVKAWRRYFSQPLVTYSRSQTIGVPAGHSSLLIELNPASAGFFNVLAQPSWDTAVQWTQINQSSFSLQFDVAAPANAFVDWVATPISNVGYGYLPVVPNTNTRSLAIQPSLAGFPFIALPTWDTNLWLSAISGSELTLSFSTQAPPQVGNLISYAFVNPSQGGNVTVPSGNDSFDISITIPKPNSPYQAFLLPTWDTAISISKTSTTISATFETPPPADSTLYYAWFQPA